MVYEIYNPENVYVTQDGNYVTPEQFAIEHNSVFDRPIAVGLEGRTIVKVEDYGYLLSIYKISNDVPTENALNIINEKVKIDSEENTPIERIAASLEYIVLNLLNGGDLS